MEIRFFFNATEDMDGLRDEKVAEASKDIIPPRGPRRE